MARTGTFPRVMLWCTQKHAQGHTLYLSCLLDTFFALFLILLVCTLLSTAAND